MQINDVYSSSNPRVEWRILVQTLNGHIISQIVELDSRDTGEHLMLQLRQVHQGELRFLARLFASALLVRRPVVSIAKIAPVCASKHFHAPFRMFE